LGGQVIFQGAVQPTDTDMSAILSQVASNPPDLLYYPIFVAAGGFITAQARGIESLNDTALMGSDGIFTPDFISAAGSGAQGMYLSSPDFAAFGSGYADFLVKHEAKYNEKPLSAFHAHAYDATNILFAAIEKVAVVDEDGTIHIGRRALRTYLRHLRLRRSDRHLTCADGDCADPKIAVYQVISADAALWNPGASADSDPKKVYP
jgi:branched-chain amino acid transport system substrate-binding protein